MVKASFGVLGEVALPWPSTSMSRQKLCAIRSVLKSSSAFCFAWVSSPASKRPRTWSGLGVGLGLGLG